MRSKDPAAPRLDWLNTLLAREATQEFLKCCGSKRWAHAMTRRRPYAGIEDLTLTSDKIWWALDQSDWLEAFRSHPKIGEKKPADTVSTQSQQWSGHEQSGVESAAQQTLDELAQLNHEYEAKFGFIFIVCATGKSAGEMLSILRSRLQNEIGTELPIAAAEQAKITEIRLKKLLN
jgi:OHCU decarboxylase